MSKMLIGSHMHTKDGHILYLLQKYHTTFQGKTVQIVGGSARFREDAECVRWYLNKTGLKLFVHSPFTWNLAKDVTHENRSLIRDLEIAHEMGAEGCILHFGKYLKLLPRDAERKFYENLVYVLENVEHLKSKLYIETCAGQGTEIYATRDGSLDELVRFYSQFTEKQKEKLKICVDTCHIYAAGYDIDTDEAAETFWVEWQEKLGIEAMGCIHFNNSAKPYRSCVDRHASLIYGHIGVNGLRTFAQHADLHKIPMIIETPFMEYDIPVLEAMIQNKDIPNIDQIRYNFMFET